jgi:hypothetical protein
MTSEGESFLGRSLSLNAEASGEIDFGIRQVSSESVWTELSSPGIRVSLQAVKEQNEFTLKSPPEAPVEVIFDRAGRIRGVKNLEALEQQNIMNFSILEVLRNYWPVFPDKPLAVGDSWPDHKRLVVPFQGMNLVIELEINFTLNDVLPGPDGRLALISTAYTVTLSGSREIEQFVGSFEGKGVGSGNVNFLMDEGYFTEYRLNYSLDGFMVMRQTQQKVMEWPFRLSASVDLTYMGKTGS